MPHPFDHPRPEHATGDKTGVIGGHDDADHQRRKRLDRTAYAQQCSLQATAQKQQRNPEQQGSNGWQYSGHEVSKSMVKDYSAAVRTGVGSSSPIASSRVFRIFASRASWVIFMPKLSFT